MKPIKFIPLSEMHTATWGKQGEHNAVQLSFDLTGWENAWPDGGPAVAFRRADGKEYAHTFTREGNTLLIPVLSYDTEIAGSCAVVISWLDNGNESRSVIINGRVNASIVSLGETPTTPEKGLIEQLNAAAAAASASETAAEEAEAGAIAAKEAAVAAQNEAVSRALEAKAYRKDAQEYASQAINAKLSTEKAQESAEEAQAAAEKAQVNAQDAAIDAQDSENAAKISEENALKYAQQAGEQNTAAAGEAAAAKEYAEEAKGALSDMANVFTIGSIKETLAGGIVVYKADKTYAEVKAAADAGKVCLLSYADGKVYMYHGEATGSQGLQLEFAAPAKSERYTLADGTIYDAMSYKYVYLRSGGNLVWAHSPGRALVANSIKFTGAVSAEYDGKKEVVVDIPEVNGIPDYTAADAGKILYISPTGEAAWLAVGAGITIENGVLKLNIKTGGDVSFTENADGSVTLNGVSFAVNDDGSVTLEGATMTEQADGSVLIN